MSRPSATAGRRTGRSAYLLRERRFGPFFATQFLGALNDGMFKIGFTSLATYQAARFGGLSAGVAAFAISAIFILPFVLFSATAGQIADKYDKAALFRGLKNIEITVMVIAAIGFLLPSALVLYVAVFLLGVHSTIFGPVKYAYLPQQLERRELLPGNGLVELGTFVAILVGTIAGGALAAFGHVGAESLAAAGLLVAITGRLTAAAVPPSQPSQPTLVINWNPLTETWRNLRLARADHLIFVGLIGISWLWFVGATFLASFFTFTKDVLGADADVVTLLLAIFSIGVGAGSIVCARLAPEHLALGMVPLGAAGMSVFAAELYFASHGWPSAAAPGVLLDPGSFIAQWRAWRVMLDLFLLAFSGGVFSVPLYAWIQRRSPATHRARIIAANNILNSAFMIVSALLAVALTSLGVTIPGLYLVVAILNVVLLTWLCWSAPTLLARLRVLGAHAGRGRFIGRGRMRTFPRSR